MKMAMINDCRNGREETCGVYQGRVGWQEVWYSVGQRYV